MLERLKTEKESENTSEGVILCDIHRRQKGGGRENVKKLTEILKIIK